jgi:biopolymer transport protein ExbB/biopolymer transport protein TolQ
MEINFVELWGGMGLAVRLVVLVLTAQAIGCIAVVCDRVWVLLQSRQRAKEFAVTVQPSMEAGNYVEVLRGIEGVRTSHLASFMQFGLHTFFTRVNAGDDSQRAAELTRRALERKGDAISRELNRGMNVLASTGSTAPFVGLLGTVLGIIHAFRLIAQNGSGGIGTIGAAIGEALIVTGYGLVVAIPSVLVFNWLSGRIADYESGLINAGSELIDRLETGIVPTQPAGQPVAAAAPVAAGATAASRPAPAWRR